MTDDLAMPVHGSHMIGVVQGLAILPADPAAFFEGFCPNCHIALAGDVGNWCPECKAYWSAVKPGVFRADLREFPWRMTWPRLRIRCCAGWRQCIGSTWR